MFIRSRHNNAFDMKGNLIKAFFIVVRLKRHRY